MRCYVRATRYPGEFKIEAVKQVTERGYKIADVADLPQLRKE